MLWWLPVGSQNGKKKMKENFSEVCKNFCKIFSKSSKFSKFSKFSKMILL